jgi:hypothetical protein
MAALRILRQTSVQRVGRWTQALVSEANTAAEADLWVVQRQSWRTELREWQSGHMLSEVGQRIGWCCCWHVETGYKALL